MKKLFLFIALLLPIAAFGQIQNTDFDNEASIRDWQNGRGYSFVLEDETFTCDLYFAPYCEYVELEVMDYEKSSKPKRIVFTPKIDGPLVKLYAPDGTYCGHIRFHNNYVFMYNTEGEFQFKIPRFI